MKKIFVIFLAICLCLTVFTSCQPVKEPDFEPQNAKALWDKMNETMDSLNSYESTGTGKISFNIANVKFSMEMEMKLIVAGLKEGDYYYYSFSEMTADQTDGAVLGSASTEIMNEKSIEAFHDGKMFISTVSKERTQKVYSSLTKEEYIAYRESQEAKNGDIDYNDCTTASFTHNEDGTWTLQYSGYTKKTVDKMLGTFGMMEMDFDFDVEDLEFFILADEEFRVKEMNVKFIFDERSMESSAPFFEIKTQYANFNAATPITDTLNPADYTEIPDCRLLTELEDMIEALEDSKNGSFTLDMAQTLTVPSLEQRQVYKETDTVTYGEQNGSYFYDIKAVSGSDTFEISYANGKQTIRISGQEQTVSQTKADAKAYINGLINTAKYSSDYVSRITKKAEGVYEIQCDRPDTTNYEAIFEAYSGDLLEISQTITVTVKDGKIEKIENYTFAKGTASTGYQRISMEIEVISTNIFNHPDNVTNVI